MKKRKKKKSIYLIFLFLLTIYLTYNYLDIYTTIRGHLNKTRIWKKHLVSSGISIA